MSELEDKISDLACWDSKVSIEPLVGGITNKNFKIIHRNKYYFVRTGEDILIHGVMRFNELTASKAAHDAGISPNVVHSESGILVLDFVDGKTLSEKDFHEESVLNQGLDLVKRCHYDIPDYLGGAVLSFWVFQVIRNYCYQLKSSGSRFNEELPKYLGISDALADAVGPVKISFGHNDLLPANFIDDGSRLWLIDWDYAGFNSVLFDLGGLASNNGLNENQESRMLEIFFGKKSNHNEMKSYHAMKCASLLRESMWSMVSEIHSDIDFDFVEYTRENLKRFNLIYEKFSGEYQ